jgi:hypothetical protein
MGNNVIHNNKNQRNSKQRELEEAMELDKMLELERRNQSMDVFEKKLDEKYDSYFQNINVPNFKNVSQGMKGIMGSGNTYQQHEDSGVYTGILPNLNVSKRECMLLNHIL